MATSGVPHRVAQRQNISYPSGGRRFDSVTRSLDKAAGERALRYDSNRRGRSSEAEHQLPKLRTRVRFSSPAPVFGQIRGVTAGTISVSLTRSSDKYPTSRIWKAAQNGV